MNPKSKLERGEMKGKQGTRNGEQVICDTMSKSAHTYCNMLGEWFCVVFIQCPWFVLTHLSDSLVWLACSLFCTSTSGILAIFSASIIFSCTQIVAMKHNLSAGLWHTSRVFSKGWNQAIIEWRYKYKPITQKRSTLKPRNHIAYALIAWVRRRHQELWRFSA